LRSEHNLLHETVTEKNNTEEHPFNGPLSVTTRVSHYQRGKTNLDFTEAREWVAVASAGPYANLHLALDITQFFTGWLPFLPPNQQHQSTEGNNRKNYRQKQFSQEELVLSFCKILHSII